MQADRESENDVPQGELVGTTAQMCQPSPGAELGRHRGRKGHVRAGTCRRRTRTEQQRNGVHHRRVFVLPKKSVKYLCTNSERKNSRISLFRLGRLCETQPCTRQTHPAVSAYPTTVATPQATRGIKVQGFISLLLRPKQGKTKRFAQEASGTNTSEVCRSPRQEATHAGQWQWRQGPWARI
jgi:hypothetical protein